MENNPPILPQIPKKYKQKLVLPAWIAVAGLATLLTLSFLFGYIFQSLKYKYHTESVTIWTNMEKITSTREAIMWWKNK